MIVVTLDDFELLQAAQVGIRRHIEAVTSGRPDRHGFDGSTGWQIHCEGACGELALAKAMNKHWSGSVNTFSSGGDVGRVQVRTRSKHDYELLVRDKDSDDDKFVLVTGTAPTYHIHGWIAGVDAKRVEWRQTHGNRPGAYFVPQSELTPIA